MLLKLLKEQILKEGVDYFIAFEDQISFAYFFNKYIDKDVYAVAYDGTNIIKNPRLEDLKNSTLGAYLGDFSYKKAVNFQNKFKIKDFTQAIDQMRVVKHPSEIEKIKQACKITKAFFDEICVDEAKKHTEKSLLKQIHQHYVNYEVKESFSPIVAFDKNSYILHHKPSPYSKLPSHTLLIDMGVQYKKYNSDMTRTFTFSSEAEKVKKDVENALEMLEDIAVEGASLPVIVEFAKQSLAHYKKSSFFYHHLLGHGVGLEVHEDPSFKEKITLKKNMVIALEPGVYVKNKYGVRIENTYVIKKKKAKSLC
ncbi:MAG: aminopeptidase P family protein [Candidatus Nanohaloarchaeota archaeon]|nr:aminopeptidase P family protein [Candidatus Nanohaloarchaeota archaeon]